MTVLPSIMILIFAATLSVMGSAILRKRWHKIVAMTLAGFELVMAIWLAGLSAWPS